MKKDVPYKSNFLKLICYNVNSLNSRISQTATVSLDENSRHAILISDIDIQKGKGSRAKTLKHILPVIFSEWCIGDASIICHTVIYPKEADVYEDKRFVSSLINMVAIRNIYQWIKENEKAKTDNDLIFKYDKSGIKLSSVNNALLFTNDNVNLITSSIHSLINLKFKRVRESLGGSFKHTETMVMGKELLDKRNTETIRDEEGLLLPFFNSLGRDLSFMVIDNYHDNDTNTLVRHCKFIYNGFVVESLYRQFVIK